MLIINSLAHGNQLVLYIIKNHYKLVNSKNIKNISFSKKVYNKNNLKTNSIGANDQFDQSNRLVQLFFISFDRFTFLFIFF